MSETIDMKTGEVIEETAVAKKGDMSSLVKSQDLPLLSVMETLDTLDWKALKPHHMALLLMQKPMNAQGGTLFLSFKQAILFATRCYELGVSPFSSEVWFNPSTATVNLTLEGKRQVARNRGIDLGPPQFEEVSREWAAVAKMNQNAEEAKKQGFPKDIGVKCRIRVGNPDLKEYSEYTAYLSEWFVPKSPVWQQKPLHMLQTRAAEKAISMTLGTGASEPVGD